jgi:hypothetical protein
MSNLFNSSSYPINIPDTLISGDSWLWSKDIGDYGTGYTLKYALTPISGGTVITITATLSGNKYLIEVPAATTNGYVASTYSYSEIILRDSDSARVVLSSGVVIVKPNPLTTTADTRSHARKVLDAIRATIEGRASIDQQSMSINGRSINRTPLADLIALETTYSQIVQREDRAEALKSGININSRQIVVRMR